LSNADEEEGRSVLGPRDELEYNALKVAQSSGDLVGSGALSEGLRRMGIEISEATAGRLLRDFDARGLTERVGFRGRRLTALGQARLDELEREQQRRLYGNEFMNVLRAHGQAELIDILVARRAIERETARLAAIHATDEEIRELGRLIESHRNAVHQGGIGAQEDVMFHRLIALASRNRVLLAATDLIRQDSQLSPVLTYIRQQVKSSVAEDHIKIYEAIAARDPERAEKAMVCHMENLIRDVRMYWGSAG